MRFQVPQFIEVEDKIFGPLTIKQFIYLLGGGGICFIFYTIFDSFIIAAIFMLPVIAFSLALAFYKVNNKPFIGVIEAAFNYYTKSKLYLWKKEVKPITPKTQAETDATSNFYVPKLSDSKLKDLTWSLDIKQSETPAQNQKGKSNM